MRGYIRTKQTVEENFNEDGETIKTPNIYGEYIPCMYHSAKRDDLVNIGDGKFTQARYIITIKNMKLRGVHFQLFDKDKNLICEEDSKLLEVLNYVKRIKIVL